MTHYIFTPEPYESATVILCGIVASHVFSRMLRVDNISKSFGETTALQGVTLAFSPGQTTVLIGPSGCGKSTLVRMLVGLVEPDSGSVYFNDQRVEPGSTQKIRRQCGYVIQRGGLFPHLTTRQNVSLLAKSLGWSDQACETRLVELLDIVQLETEKLVAYPGELSGGQRQRVSLMRALMLDPTVLLLDEPLGALDPLIKTDLQRDLKKIFSDLRKTVVLVTHDLAEAAFFGDEIVLMQAGMVVQRGSYEDLRQSPADPFVTTFIEAQTERIAALLGGGSP